MRIIDIKGIIGLSHMCFLRKLPDDLNSSSHIDADTQLYRCHSLSSAVFDH